MRLFRGVHSVKVTVIKMRSCIAWGAREPLSDVRCNFLKRTYSEADSSTVPLAFCRLCKSMKEILAAFSLKNLLLSWCGWQRYCEFCHRVRSGGDLPIRYVY